jgi:hypothetical protein
MSIFATRQAASPPHKGHQDPLPNEEIKVLAASDTCNGSPPTELVRRVVHKRTAIETYLASAVSRQRRLLNLTIIAGAFASALSAVPALGGKPLMDWLTSTFGLSSPSWQTVCAAAAACSLIATIATLLLKTRNLEERVARAQEVRAKLEILEVRLEAGQMNHAEASSELMKCIENVAFIHG